MAGWGEAPLVIIVVRGDFWDRCAAHAGLARSMQHGQFVVGPMTESDLRLAITGPADSAGLRIDAALTDLIMSDLRSAGSQDAVGVLPLLSQAMLLTWENREGRRLTSRGYGQAGGVSHAVQVSADEVYDSLPEERKTVARETLRRMTVVDSERRLTRRRVPRHDLLAGRPDQEQSQVDVVLEAFAGKRLVVLNAGTAEIAHDVLLHAWPRLRAWLEEDQASLILHGQLAEDAAAWRENGKDSSFLYRGTQLAALKQATTAWTADPTRHLALTATEAEFLRAGERAAVRGGRRRRALAVTLALLLVAALTGAGISVAAAKNAGRQQSIAEQQRSAAVSERLAAQSEALEATDPVTASLLAVAASRIAPTAQAHYSLLKALAQPERGVFRTGDGVVTAVAFSPDGRTLAAGYQSGIIRLWNPVSRHLIGKLTVGNGVTALAFSADGSTLRAAVRGAVMSWDLASKQKTRMPLPRSYYGAYASFSSDGKIMASGDDGMARLWDLANQRQIGAPIPAGGFTPTVALSPDGRIVAVAGRDGTQLWDVANQQPIGGRMATRAFSNLAFSPNGKILATGSNGAAQLWDVATQQPTGPAISTTEPVVALAFSSDSTVLATGENTGPTQLWDVAGEYQIGTSLNPKGVQLVNTLAFSPARNILVTGNQDGTVRLWDPLSFRQNAPPTFAVPRTGPGRRIVAITLSSDGKILTTADGGGFVKTWDLTTQKQIGAAIPTGAGVSALALNPDGKMLAVAAHSVEIWTIANDRLIRKSSVFRHGDVNTIAFRPGSSNTLAIGGIFSGARFWNTVNRLPIGKPLAKTPSKGEVGETVVAFSPNGKMLATAGHDGIARLWDVAAQQQIGAPMTASAGAVSAVAFSRDGKMLATAGGDGTARLWDVAAQQQIGAPLTGNARPVSAVAFSPDGKILATAGLDGTARLWDVATQQQIGAPLTINTPALSNAQVGPAVAFSPDGKILATAGSDGIARLWDVEFPSNLRQAACAIAGQTLTRRQWTEDVGNLPFVDVCPPN